MFSIRGEDSRQYTPPPREDVPDLIVLLLMEGAELLRHSMPPPLVVALLYSNELPVTVGADESQQLNPPPYAVLLDDSVQCSITGDDCIQ